MKNKRSALGAIKILIDSRNTIFKELEKVIKDNSFYYRTFGVDIENYISDILVKIFTRRSFIKSKKDYVLAPDKNYFPDFELKTLPPLAIEYKSGNKSKLSKGKWVECRNSNNDMGTLNMWSKKIKKFGGENIYYIFIVYKFDNQNKKIIDLQIDPFYKFIGLNKDGLLKYREKDGNLRPRDFDGKPIILSFRDFEQLLDKTAIYRSKRIIKKHQAILKSFRSKK
jgi:hypothetical protein